MVTKKQLDEVLDQRVRPYLKSHGGEVTVLSCVDGVVSITLTGACAGCPSAELGTRAFVEEQVKAALPQVVRVELEQTVSQELLDMARAILHSDGR